MIEYAFNKEAIYTILLILAMQIVIGCATVKVAVPNNINCDLDANLKEPRLSCYEMSEEALKILQDKQVEDLR